MNDFKLSESSSLVLDLIRGVSSQIVVVGHGIIFSGIFTFLRPPNVPLMQNIAVLIFFLLSGFLITYSTVRNKLNKPEYSFKYYFYDRFSRIYTAYIPALIFVLLLDSTSKLINPDSYIYSESFNIRTLIGNLFMLQDYPLFTVFSAKFSTSFGSARPFWTLAVEWWIYLFFGYVALNIINKKKLNLYQLLILLFLAVVPIFNLVNGRGNGLFVYWIFGAIVYLAIARNILKNTGTKIKILLLSALLCAAAIRIYLTRLEYEPIFAFILSLILFLIIDICSEFSFSEKISRIIRFNASYSYTLYLVHYSIFDFLTVRFKDEINPYLLFIIGFLLSNIISILLGRYTEISLTRKVKSYLYARELKTA